MPTQDKIREAGAKAADSPVAWFAAFEAAMNRRDLPAARRALGELRRLGVHVTFERREVSDG